MGFGKALRSDFFSSIPLFLILSMVIFGGDAAILVAPTLVLFLIVHRDQLKWPSGRSLTLILLLAQYQLLHLIKVVFFEDKPEGIEAAPAAGPELWLWSLLALVLLAPYLEMFQGQRKVFTFLVPLVVLVGFTGLGIDYATSNLCRVESLNGGVFSTPLAMTSLTIAWLGMVDFRNGWIKLLGAGMIVACLVSASAFAGVRGILLAQIAVVVVLIGYSLVGRKIEMAVLLLSALMLGLAIGVAVDIVSGCSFARRIQLADASTEDSLRVLADAATTIDRSTSLRLQMWANAISLIKDAPLFGHGISFEPNAAGQAHLHVHNIYLSWMIWGGIASLTSGMLFLLSPMLADLSTALSKVRFFGICGITGIWAISMMFDSFLVWQGFHMEFLIFAMVIFKVTEAQE